MIDGGDLRERQIRLGARVVDVNGREIPRDYGDVRDECAALRAGAGLVDLSHWRVVQIRGDDRAAWLHRMTTADVLSLQQGNGTRALVLNATAHVLAEFTLLVRPQYLTLYSSAIAAEKLLTRLRRSIFRERVQLLDVTSEYAVLTLEGDRAATVLTRVSGSPPPAVPYQNVEMRLGEHSLLVVRNPRAGKDGLDLLSPRTALAALWDLLVSSGGRPAGIDALNTVRVEAGIPRYGDDYDETVLAPEARLESLIADDKGCYPGQEVIARIKHRGHVNRLVAQMRVEGERVPEHGDRIICEGRDVGVVTSAVWSFAQQAPMALGYVRRELASPATRVEIGRGETRLIATVIGP